MFERRIEEAGLNSWPALQQHLFDGWVIRFARGYTKRANSVTPLYPQLLPIEEKIERCEHFYEEKKLPVIFRLPSFAEESQALDQLLERRGYRYLDRTLVWSARLSPGPEVDDAAWRLVPLESWFPIYRQFSVRYMEQQHLHRELLERIAPPVMYAALYEQGVPVACGLGVLEHEALGIFDVVTDPERRRKGYGRRLVVRMLNWGRQRGAQYAYLQVMDTNQAARRMYEQLGFQDCYYYWYRVRE
ncbi:MAG: GNAT family N-acetyltransferase [Ktedonobacteraceae bacterium]|nr:GNAT family N-acetyltransferase [Ktedonobacteraceae bacterium]MBO0792986.1 GNAT family N-acetyltransferase [Ktedonobacteraceae bacterium]